MSLIRPKTLVGLTGMQGQNSSINFRSQNRHSQPFWLCVNECMDLNGCMFTTDISMVSNQTCIFAMVCICICMCVLGTSRHSNTYIDACINEMGGK